MDEQMMKHQWILHSVFNNYENENENALDMRLFTANETCGSDLAITQLLHNKREVNNNLPTFNKFWIFPYIENSL